MTHDERIKAMAEAIFKADFPDDQDLWDECEGDMQAVYNRMATAALAAAGVEEMVREAVFAGAKHGYKCAWRGDYAAQPCDIDDLVREVMGK
jgi:hypothetical protein